MVYNNRAWLREHLTKRSTLHNGVARCDRKLHPAKEDVKHYTGRDIKGRKEHFSLGAVICFQSRAARGSRSRKNRTYLITYKLEIRITSYVRDGLKENTHLFQSFVFFHQPARLFPELPGQPPFYQW
jgi:hypothetical protein